MSMSRPEIAFGREPAAGESWLIAESALNKATINISGEREGARGGGGKVAKIKNRKKKRAFHLHFHSQNPEREKERERWQEYIHRENNHKT